MELFSYCINNLHMYRTLYQGLYLGSADTVVPLWWWCPGNGAAVGDNRGPQSLSPPFAVLSGLQGVKANVPFPLNLLNHGRDNPHYKSRCGDTGSPQTATIPLSFTPWFSLYFRLTWKWKNQRRRRTQRSGWRFIISPRGAHSFWPW